MNNQKTCQACGHELAAEARFCTSCGRRLVQKSQTETRAKEILNLRILYAMAGLLVLAVLFPPWESSPGSPPAYLGMHFILSPPEPEAVVSRILQTVELVTIAIGGMYLAWVFRDKV
ncbi:MAG: zinc ribbon domain-containing protein [Nitrospira sp. SB0677_bin_15]|nr:zinc ribbon domain-containing protein [Nitrospira sp. SB0677_bin_15]